MMLSFDLLELLRQERKANYQNRLLIYQRKRFLRRFVGPYRLSYLLDLLNYGKSRRMNEKYQKYLNNLK